MVWKTDQHQLVMCLLIMLWNREFFYYQVKLSYNISMKPALVSPLMIGCRIFSCLFKLACQALLVLLPWSRSRKEVCGVTSHVVSYEEYGSEMTR